MLRFPRTLLTTMLLMGVALPALAQSEEASLTDGAPVAEVPMDFDATALQEMFPDGMPAVLSPQSFARSYSLPSRFKPADKPATGIDYSDGSVNFNVGTKVTGNRPAGLPPASSMSVFNPNGIGAAGGSGEVTGQFRYAPDKDWELYGSRRVGVVQSDGLAPAMNESATVGARYQLPEWMAGGKIGASYELTPAAERKARIEYRRPIGPAEGYLAAEQVQPPVATDPRPASVRAGVNRKF